MSSTALSALNSLSEVDAAAAFAACCGSSAWVAQMLAGRPYASSAQLFARADAAAQALSSDDWLEAFSHHPRIGERKAAASVSSVAAGWSAGEQAGMDQSSDSIQHDLAIANAEYVERFGFIFIVCATGLSAESMLAALRERLGNAPDAELSIAVREQQKITQLRLRKLLGED